MTDIAEILTDHQLEELYRSGYRVVPVGTDPFEIPAALIKPDWSYQWFPDGEHPKGWKGVAYQAHPGWFAPPDKEGLVVVQGMRLFRKLKTEVEEFHRQNQRKAEKLVEDWADKFGMFTGGATVLQGHGEEVIRTDVVAGKGAKVKVETYERPKTGTVELVSHIPKDMIPHVEAIFEERDRLISEVVLPDRSLLPGSAISEQFYTAIERDKGAPWWPTLMAIVLPYAIENVRKANFSPNQYEAESRS